MVRIIVLIVLVAALLGSIIFLEFTRSPDGDGPPVGKVPPSRAAELLAMHHEGVSRIEQHRFQDAEAVLLRLVEAVPDAYVPRFNLGIAQLNQAEEGVGRALPTLLAAREIHSDDPRVPYGIGIIHRFTGDEEQALAEFRRAFELAPNDPDANYQVAMSLSHLGDREAALPYFEMAARLDPTLKGAWNNLQLLYRRDGRVDDANRALAEFQALEESGRGRAHSTKYTEQGELSRAIRDWNVRLPAAIAPIAIEFGTPGWLRPEPRNARPAPPMALVDLDLDCIPDLWVGGPNGAIYSLADEPTESEAPPALRAASTFAVGDLDEDGVPDLVIAGGGRISVHRLESPPAAGAPLPEFTVAQSIEVPELGEIAELRLVDLDLEGDLDLVIVPVRGAPRIALNEGRSLREPGDPTLPWPDAPDRRGVGLVAARDLDGDFDADLVFTVPDAPHLRWIENAPQWGFALDDADLLPVELGAVPLVDPVVADLDGDGDDDLLAIANGTATDRFRRAPGAGLVAFFGAVEPLAVELAGAPGETVRAATLVDLDLDGALDLLLALPGSGEGAPLTTAVLRNAGDGSFERVVTLEVPAVGFVVGDVDGDLDPDVIAVSPGGTPILVRNETDPGAATTPHHAARLYLGGKRDGADRRTNLLGYGARVELRAGDRLVARTFEGSIGHRAQGLAPLVLGIGARTEADSITIFWPDGVSQSETEFPLDTCHTIEEVQRKASSCPVLFTWDGRGYRFITDFMGGGGLGFWIGPDEYAFPEPTEVVRIAPEALAPIDGELRLSVMEPMQESCTIDRLELVSIDHPAGTEVYPFEYFPVRGPAPSGAPLVVEEAARRFPAAVADAIGTLDATVLHTVDRTYAGPRSLDPDLVGYAARQEWTITFPTEARAEEGSERTYLFVDGWVEYPYSRINFAAWQRGGDRDRRLEAPTFRWDRGDGDWRTIGEELGYPAGMPKTMVLDVTDAIAAGATRFRIETNLELYLDRTFLAPARELADDAPERRIVPLERATLRYGGYPREYSDDGALPLTYHYDERDATLGYLPMGGMFTRYGRVEPLLEAVDDRFCVMGGGDELHLRYDATALPALPDGERRTYLLDTHGYCKDRDPLTATPDSVEPLPFGSMSNYPPAPTDVEPDRAEYRARWNTRRD